MKEKLCVSESEQFIMGLCCCASNPAHHKLPQSDESDDTNSSEDEEEQNLCDFKDDLANHEYGDNIFGHSPSNHFLFKQRNYLSWYTDDVAFRHSQHFIKAIKSRYLECDKENRIEMNRYLEIDARRGHTIACLSPYFKNTTIFECSKRFATALNERFPANKYKSNNIRVIEDKLFDYFAPKQDLMPQEFADGFSLIILHDILNVVDLQKWDILIKYMIEILSNNKNGSLLIISCLSSEGILMNLIQNYIPNYRGSNYLIEYITNLKHNSEWKESNIIIESWENNTKLVYTEEKAIKIYLEILQIMFTIYDKTLFERVKIELQKSLKSMLIIDGYYSDQRDEKTGEYNVTVELCDVHILVRKN